MCECKDLQSCNLLRPLFLHLHNLLRGFGHGPRVGDARDVLKTELAEVSDRRFLLVSEGIWLSSFQLKDVNHMIAIASVYLSICLSICASIHLAITQL